MYENVSTRVPLPPAYVALRSVAPVSSSRVGAPPPPPPASTVTVLPNSTAIEMRSPARYGAPAVPLAVATPYTVARRGFT